MVNSINSTLKVKYPVNHIDGNKTNNYVKNLEIVTQSENVQHSCYELGNSVKPVYMLDKDSFAKLKEFQSMAKAAEELNIDDAAIYKVCINERNFAGGYSWIFMDDYCEENILTKKEKLFNKNKHRCKRVAQIDPETNEVIAIFEGARQAIKQTGIKTIISCASGHCKSAGGYLWRYVE